MGEAARQARGTSSPRDRAPPTPPRGISCSPDSPPYACPLLFRSGREKDARRGSPPAVSTPTHPRPQANPASAHWGLLPCPQRDPSRQHAHALQFLPSRRVNTEQSPGDPRAFFSSGDLEETSIPPHAPSVPRCSLSPHPPSHLTSTLPSQF